MNTNLKQAKKLLIEGGHTCVFINEREIITSDIRGVKPLLLRLEQSNLVGYCAADRVVGGAAAFLYILLKPDAVYAHILSKRAKEIFEQFGTEFYYDTLCEYVINRKGDGKCPMENAVSEINNPNDALEAIKTKLKTLNNIT